MRDRLIKLMRSHLIIMQDIPKTADHSASRTIYLWRVSLESCMHNLTLDCYETLSNLKRRSEFQLVEDKVLLEKIARSDISEDPDQFLSTGEKDSLEMHYKTVSFLRTRFVLCIPNVIVNSGSTGWSHVYATSS